MTHALSPKNFDSTSPDAAAEARDQAKAYDSLFANREVELDDGTTLSIPPHPDFSMLDDENMAAYEQLQFEVESYDREEDIYIPEQHLDNGVVLPATTQRGAVKRPFRKTDPDTKVTTLITPPYSVRAVQAALGDAAFKRLKEGGKNAADVWRVWGAQGLEVKERQGRSLRNAGAVDLAAVPEADSQ